MNKGIEYCSLDFYGKPADILEGLKAQPYSFLLESSLPHPERGRFSFIGFDPFYIYKGRDEASLQNLRKKFFGHFGREVRNAASSLTPFPCGMMGYISYDLGLSFEEIDKDPRKYRGTIPEVLFGFYDCILTIDHKRGKLIVTSSGLPSRGLLRKKRAVERMQMTLQELPAKFTRCGPAAGKRIQKVPGIKTNFSKPAYLAAVRKCLGHIRAGDIYQVNLSQQFCLEGTRKLRTEDSLEIYSLLRGLSPSCFGAYFDCGDFQIISSSPERFLRLEGDKVATRPMKGTRPRGMNLLTDVKRRAELHSSCKDQAELLMITDLERNDLGRVCRPGSIRVCDMRTMEEYKTVFQTTSAIEGRLKEGEDAFSLLEAAFPGGSITGCPKIRSMQIIEQLERSPRQMYTGILGYLSPFWQMDFNILIRTFLVRGRKVFFHAGGGIVADSQPEAEYQETRAKAKAMQACLRQVFRSRGRKAPFERKLFFYLDGKVLNAEERSLSRFAPGQLSHKGLFETLLVREGRICLLNQHLRRLRHGLRDLEISFSYSEQDLERTACLLVRKNRLKSARLRIVVWSEGSKEHLCILCLPYRPYAPRVYERGFHAVVSSFPFWVRPEYKNLKSLDYRVFANAFEEARAKKYDEALLINSRGFIVEASRANLFFVQQGRLRTPSLAGGCLPGIIRQEVIKIAGREHVPCFSGNIRPVQLGDADEAFLTNSLIGIMPLVAVEGRLINRGKVGPLTKFLLKKYKKIIATQGVPA